MNIRLNMIFRKILRGFNLYALLSGLLLAFSRYPKLSFLVFLAFLPLIEYFSQKKTGWKEAIKFAGSFFGAYLLAGLWWIGHVSVASLLGIFILFFFYFSIFFLITYITVKITPRYWFLCFSIYWVAFEYGMNFGELRFPWLNAGYALGGTHYLIQVAEWGGVYLLSFLVLWANYLLYLSLKKRKYFGFYLFFIAVWLFCGYRQYYAVKLVTHPVKLAIAQVSIPQEKKWESNYLDSTFFQYERAAAEAKKEGANLVLWPESALPVYLLKNTFYLLQLMDFARTNKICIFTGFPDYEPVNGEKDKYDFYNSAALVDTSASISAPFRKMKLVPFGERIPFLEQFPILWNLHLGQANFSYGDSLRVYHLGNKLFSPIICFEVAFPDLNNNIARRGVDFVVNLTNDAWYKRSVGTYQHAMLTRFRAIETRTMYLRAANTGISLIVDARGEIIRSLGLYKKGILTAELSEPAHKRATFFVRYGNEMMRYFAFLAICLVLFMLVTAGKLKMFDKK